MAALRRRKPFFLFWTDQSNKSRSLVMARHKEFDRDTALHAAIGVFSEHGYEGTSTGELLTAMKISLSKACMTPSATSAVSIWKR